MLFVPLLDAHFHAICGEHELIVSIQSLAVIQGDAPDNVRRIVLEWASRHQSDLMIAWRRCAARLCPQAIPPLP